MPFSRVNPKQARRFSEGIGQLAKTDKVDAVLLARMGSLLDLEAEQPRAHSSNVLKDLATARQALIRDRTAAKARAQTADIPLLKTQFSRRLKQIEHDLAQVEAAILSVIVQDEALSESAEILTSIPGIATGTACAMLTEMPELGKLSGKQAASLAGLAPLSGHCCAMPCRATTNVTAIGEVARARAYSRWLIRLILLREKFDLPVAT
jgi:transposase